MPLQKKIKVVVFEDKPELRESLVAVLESHPDIECCGAWENCAEAEHIADIYRPDIVLMDIDMPVVNGIEGTKKLSAKYPALPVVMLTVFDDDANIFEAICAGATGYLLKKTSPEKIITSLFEVLDGGAPMTSSIAKKVLQIFPKKQAVQNTDMYHLTPRETDILTGLSKGQSYKLISADLGISIETVRSHIKKIYEKLHVNSATQAVSRFLNSR